MAADCCEEGLPAHPAPASAATEARPGMRLYQAATLLVILLFLLSFWSC
jgi:hypothetical protein